MKSTKKLIAKYTNENILDIKDIITERIENSNVKNQIEDQFITGINIDGNEVYIPIKTSHNNENRVFNMFVLSPFHNTIRRIMSIPDNTTFIDCRKSNLKSINIQEKDNIEYIFCSNNPNLLNIKLSKTVRRIYLDHHTIISNLDDLTDIEINYI